MLYMLTQYYCTDLLHRLYNLILMSCLVNLIFPHHNFYNHYQLLYCIFQQCTFDSLCLLDYWIYLLCKLLDKMYHRLGLLIQLDQQDIQNIQMELSLVTTCMIQRDNILNVHHYHQQMPMHHHIMYP